MGNHQIDISAGRPVVSVGIVEDNPRDRAHIESLLNQFEHENSVSFSVRKFDDGAAILDHYQPDYDIIFLDIQMSGIDGMRTATAIRQVDTKVVLIFVTNTSQYATTGYSVNAQSYLLKPVTYFAFHTEMQRALSRLQQLERESILVGSGSSLRRLDIADIVYLESNRHRMTIHTVSEEIVFSGTLKSLESDLAPRNFYRANSGYLVNLRHLKAITGEDALMSNGDVLKVSRSRKKGLMEALTNYIGSGLTAR
ncbi:response regulator transcription factor [Arcanobacterium haemolyticum]|nr:response regulator transcription factor [Arcanobacterium haemolyticum]